MTDNKALIEEARERVEGWFTHSQIDLVNQLCDALTAALGRG